MKIINFMVLFFAAFCVSAQNFPPMNMDPQQMQAMMQKAQQVQECMSKISEEEMRAVQEKMQKMQNEVDALCQAGKRDEAMEKAMDMAKEISQDPTLKQMKKCGEIMKGVIPPLPEIANLREDGKPKRHVCD